MIKDNQKGFNRFHVVLDGLVTAGSYLLAWYLMLEARIFPVQGEVLAPRYYFMALILIVPGYLILYGVFHLYTPKRVQGRRVEFANICKANTIGLLLFTMVLFAIRNQNPFFNEFATRVVLGFFAINTFMVTLERNVIRMVLRSLRSKGYNQKHILLIGYSRAAEGFIDRVLANPEWGYRIRGILDDHHKTGEGYRNIPVVGTISQLNSFLESNTLD